MGASGSTTSTTQEAEDRLRWKDSFGKCAPTLEALARAQDEPGRLAARTWWVVCMANQCGRCKDPYDEWRSQAAATLPSQLTAEHTESVVSLPGWKTMAQCVVDSGRRVGIEVANTLNHVERKGMEMQDCVAWDTAVAEVEPMRAQLQRTYLSHGLARSAGAMDIDELRVCQLWMYGLATRLSECRKPASDFAEEAGMRDANAPMLGYDEERWDPNSDGWRTMETCVHAQAAKANTESDSAWRRSVASAG